MRSREVAAIMSEIRGVSGRFDKLEILSTIIHEPFVQKLLKYTYDSSINFYVTPASLFDVLHTTIGGEDFGEELFELLDELNSRKLSGSAAIARINAFSEQLDEDSKGLLLEVFGRSFNVGLNAISINSLYPDLIEIPPYMRCSTEKEVPLSTINFAKGQYIQPKLNGEFLRIIFNDSSKEFRTRENSLFPSEYMAKILGISELQYSGPSCEIHGEIRIRDEYGNILPRETGNGILNSIMQGGTLPPTMTMFYIAWDVVSLKEISAGMGSTPYRARFGELLRLFTDMPKCMHVINTREVTSAEDAITLRDHFVALGDEGAVLKDPDSFWKNGTNRKIIKLKVPLSNNLRVIGFTEGNGKFEGMVGALTCTSEEGKLLVNVSGFNEGTRRQITENRSQWLYKIVEVKHGGVIEAKTKGALPSLIEPVLLHNAYLHDVTIADDLPKIRRT